jgi:hypothetical protein
MSISPVFLTTQTQQLNINSGLFGAVAKTTGSGTGGKIPLYKRGSIDNPDNNVNAILLLLISILITVIIFVAVIASYDVIRDKIIIHFAKKTLMKPHNTREDIQLTMMINEASYRSTLTFAFFAVIFAVCTLPLLIWAYIKVSK